MQERKREKETKKTKEKSRKKSRMNDTFEHLVSYKLAGLEGHMTFLGVEFFCLTLSFIAHLE